MTLIRLAWRNLWRNAKRTFLMMAIVAVGTWAIVVFWGLTEGFFTTTINSQKNIDAGDLQIHKSGYLEDPSLNNALSSDQLKTIEDNLKEFGTIKGWAPRMELEGLLSTAYGASGMQIRGVDPLREAEVTIIDQAVVEGRFIKSTGEIVLSQKIAQDLDARIGERVVIDVQGKESPKSLAFNVVGLYHTSLSELNLSMIYISLDDAQKLSGVNGASEVIISIKEGSNPKLIANELGGNLNDKLVISTFMDLNPLIKQMMLTERIEMIPIMFLLAILAGFGVANTVMFTVLERTREFGVMIALGMKPKKLARMVITESIISSGFGFALGGGVGYILNYWLSQVGLNFGAFSEFYSKFGIPTVIYSETSGWYWLYSLSVVVLAGIMAAWYPARRTERIEPTEAMRHV